MPYSENVRQENAFTTENPVKVTTLQQNLEL